MPTLVKSRPAVGPSPTPTGPLAWAHRWPRAWAEAGFRGRLLLALAALVGVLLAVPGFYQFVQARPGRLLPDPLLALLPVRDVSGPIFMLMYGGIAATLVHLLARPHRLLRMLWAYFFVQLLRMGTLWLLPLEPPAALVLLHDPVTDRIFEVTTQPIVRDLFFSGHTATMALLVLAVRGRKLRRALLLMAVAVGLLVLIQRVHYSYDVLAAPLFAWLAYWLAGRVAVLPDRQQCPAAGGAGQLHGGEARCRRSPGLGHGFGEKQRPLRGGTQPRRQHV